MISFRDYLTEPPKILCGIPHGKKSKSYLFEELHAEPFHFIIPTTERHKYEARAVAAGVLHVKKFGQNDRYLVHRGIGKTPIEFNDLDAAKTHAQHQQKKEYDNVMAIHDKLSRHYYQTQVKHEVPLKTYGDGSVHMNHALMNGETPEQALRLDHAMTHRETPDDMVVYSGISPDHASKVAANDLVHHPSFLSTSLHLNVAAGFSMSQGSNHMLKIHVPAGHRGVYIGDVGKHKHEREFLLPRGLKLRIHRDKETVVKGNDMDIHIHHATIES